MIPVRKEAPYQHMGPSLLASVPPSLKTDEPKAGKNWTEIYNHLESRMKALRVWRMSWWSHWAQLAEYILPKRYHWLVVPNLTARGASINSQIIDSTGTLAMQVCASGLWTGLTSPSRPWFSLDKALPWVELDEEGKEWLEDTEQRLYTVLGQSNFYTTLAQAFQDVVTFGTAPVIIYEDHEDVIRCYLPCAGEYYLAAGARLSVDTLYREFSFTVSQIVEQFGLENCPGEVRKLWEQAGEAMEREFIVAHCIEPNSDLGGKDGKDGKDGKKVRVVPSMFTWREVYWLRGIKGDAELCRAGFNERPFMAARWSTTSNDPYGRSPGMDAIGDIKQLQMETRRKAEFIEKLVRPPMIADVELKNEPSSIIPGNITYVNTGNGRKGFMPAFEVAPAALMPMIEDIKVVEERINRCFFVDIFMAISRMEGVQPRNELELTKRDLERLQVLGPFIELFETEFASPAIQRVLAIMERRRMLKPMPASLAKVPLKINYVSIMKLAQRSSETVSMKDFLQTAGALSAAAKAAGVPDPLRIVNLDKSMRVYGDLANFPAEAIFTENEVKQADAAKAKAMKMQMAQQQAMQATTAGVQAAKTLSETNVGGGNALGAMLGQGMEGQ